MKSKILFLIVFLLYSLVFRAQSVMPDVVASSGDFYSNSSGQLQWTLGEVMVETYQNSGQIITQGFHQNFNVNTGINTYNSSDLKIYPNPANEFVSVTLNDLSENYIISLMDITGKILHSEDSRNSEKVIRFSLKDYSNGMYILKVHDADSNFNQAFRIIKIN